ncbi:cupin 2 domain-containing protein [Sinobacterium caligoides]|uniref:Cupin 2 domain-containing protein n=1 Tax=Sinobacterium caligoides TaxID=933926 RepID=A0A3N2DY86_9GAMM|nr:cupin domain-containing protein [Sinobacterium caligoides]ROS04747.1 cupin 2 domain-containing protein [Sinobacterium caligoides]
MKTKGVSHNGEARRLSSLFAGLPGVGAESEHFQLLLEHSGCRFERIVSRGQTTPLVTEAENFLFDGWYDQPNEEWVLLLAGEAELAFDTGAIERLKIGDCLLIPAHCKHRVSYTATDETTVWLAVFFPS